MDPSDCLHVNAGEYSTPIVRPDDLGCGNATSMEAGGINGCRLMSRSTHTVELRVVMIPIINDGIACLASASFWGKRYSLMGIHINFFNDCTSCAV